MNTALAYENLTSTDNLLLNYPERLQPSHAGTASSVQLTQFFLVKNEFSRIQDEPEWIDEAPMVLPSRGRIRVRITGVRRMTFSAVGSEFQAED